MKYFGYVSRILSSVKIFIVSMKMKSLVSGSILVLLFFYFGIQNLVLYRIIFMYYSIVFVIQINHLDWNNNNNKKTKLFIAHRL